MGTHFFAMLSRMKYINRWSLMHNTREENLCEHSLEVAVIAHALAVLRNERFSGCVDVGRVALLGMYHDTSEVITGDLPTPVKYHNPELRAAYRQVEEEAQERLLTQLPDDLRPTFESLLCPTEEDAALWKLVKAADKLSALIKCLEERRMGNQEFEKAEISLRAALDNLEIPEVSCFLNEFLPSYSLTLDEQESCL